ADKCQQSLNIEMPINMSQDTFNEVCNIFKIYCNAENFFLPSHLELISQCTRAEILKPLFEHYLPGLFGMEIPFKLPMQTVGDAEMSKPMRKTKYDECNLKKEWLQRLKSYCINSLNNICEQSLEFRRYLLEFYEKLAAATKEK
ncbi:22009_t:CDS:1, partial [Racocetra persica]